MLFSVLVSRECQHDLERHCGTGTLHSGAPSVVPTNVGIIGLLNSQNQFKFTTLGKKSLKMAAAMIHSSYVSFSSYCLTITIEVLSGHVPLSALQGCLEWADLTRACEVLSTTTKWAFGPMQYFRVSLKSFLLYLNSSHLFHK